MPLSWNEIKDRALAFSNEWADETSEDAEAKTFWDSFFNVFGITRRRIASFETPVKDSDGKGGFIDLLWRGVLRRRPAIHGLRHVDYRMVGASVLHTSVIEREHESRW